jgi:magnesium transporter
MKKDKKQFDITRPDKILMAGLRTLGTIGDNLTFNLYSTLKSESKGKAQTVFIGKKKLEKVAIQLFEYSPDDCMELDQPNDFSALQSPDPEKSYWLNFHGLHEVSLYEDLSKAMSFDRLMIRQMLDTTQRPKVEEYDKYLFFSVKSILQTEEQELNIEQISFILGKNYIISLQEEEGDHFDHIRYKIREKLGMVRHRKSDFLLVQLLDAVLDNYFETIDAFNLIVAELEKEVLKDPTQNTLLKLEKYKKDTQLVKKSLMPFKEALTNILNGRTNFIENENEKYFHDLLNSCKNAMDEIESTSKSLESLANIYFSSLSQKMNETMKVLTTVATIFIPLTFIAGIYGMNFEYMPELKYRYGYFVVWGVMGLVLILMLIYFKRKKWL